VLSFERVEDELIEVADCGGGGIAIVVLTHNRVNLLRKCVEHVLLRTSAETREIVIWDNASTDGTGDYLNSLADPRIRVVRNADNIGQSAYARAFKLTTAPYMIELDDDIVAAPAEWDRTLRDTFRKLPTIGFLSADLEDDPNDVASQHRHHIRAHEYTPFVESGVSLLRGPTGGGCAMTSRAVYDRVGGFREHPKDVFFLEDAAYVADVIAHGYSVAVLPELRVHHTGGAYYATESKEKLAYWDRWKRRRARRERLRRVAAHLPFFEWLNEQRRRLITRR
jgi:GT2 family glycosyltransferase